MPKAASRGVNVDVATAAVMSGSAVARTPESLRERQRDRTSPRGRPGKSNRISTAVLERDSSPEKRPRSKMTGTGPPPDLIKKRQLQEDWRKERGADRRGKRGPEDGKNDIAPDGGSAAREGRHFTVANVGNNGRIYLRPTIRPANQRYPQPSFVFPITPPSTAGLEALVSRNGPDDVQRDSLWTASRSPGTPRTIMEDFFSPDPTATNPPVHRRTQSYSTVDDHQHAPVRDADVGAFKVVIERPGTGSKTRDNFAGIPTLEVPIPSYKLGTPRFSTRGTAFLRGSYTTVDDLRSSVFTHTNISQREMASNRPTPVLSRRHSDASPQLHLSAFAPPSPLTSSSVASPMIVHQRTPIVPEMYDSLTFKPACDHPSVVRYALGGGIRAATPARLVAEITSPTFVDYDLLSDFFLTFRTFLETSDLLYMLVARLKWAISRDDETGTVVRVRTFVAIRHWILNYFLDDYVIDYDLRKAFCELLNAFVEELSQDTSRAKVPLKIIWELKKCWRRVCALYWDGPEFDSDLGPQIPIFPGGVAGSRDPRLDPSFWEAHPAGPPRLDGIIDPDFEADSSTMDGRNFFADVSRAGHLDSMMIIPANHTSVVDSEDQPPLSPSSMMSDDFVSCSFPSRGRAIGSAHPLAAHPIPASSIYDNAPPVAMTPKALTGKRVRPAHSHKRSGSFSDSFRDHRTQQPPVQRVLYRSTELLLTLPYAGSLVRGNLFPPGQAFVDVVAPRTPAEANRATTLFPRTPPTAKGPSAMSGPGMKKLLGSVRRALSTRTGGSSPSGSPTQGSFPHIPPLGIRGATINRLPGTAVVPQARPHNVENRSPMRIDLLGAEIAEDFKNAVREDAQADADHREASETRSLRSSEHDPGVHYSTMRPDTTLEPMRSPINRAPVSEVTNGSKSIVIVDDTLTEPLPLPLMTGALQSSKSVDTFADAFMQPSGGPTPPSTPPEAPLGTPRRSSQLLGEGTRHRSLSFGRTPSRVVDSPLRDTEPSPNHRPIPRALYSGALSSRSKKSVSLRRYASFHSGFTRHKSEISFDASTFSDTGGPDRLSHAPSVPLPLRVLRRRPGGDLRAATNVGELNNQPLRRPMSMGSITTYSDSIRSSYLLGDSAELGDFANNDYDLPQAKANTFSLGALAEASPKPHISFFSTHSSKPVMRPSFEKDAQMLAQIPDDVDDDGGVESALLKLEGKFEQRHSDISGKSIARGIPGVANSFGLAPQDVSTLTLDDDDEEEEEEEEEKRKHRHQQIVESNRRQSMAEIYPPTQQPYVPELKPAVYQPTGMQKPYSAPLSPRSVDSYNSIPLLERGSIDDDRDGRQTRNWSDLSVLRGPSNERHDESMNSSHPNSFDFIDETDSLKHIPIGDTKPHHESGDQSFLDSDTDARSDLSSELSLEVISRTEYTEHDSTSTQTFPPIRPGTVMKEMALPSHPLRHPPSPPMTLVQALSLAPNSAIVPLTLDGQTEKGHKILPLTPETSPIAAGHWNGFEVTRGASPSMDPLRSHCLPEASRKTSVHLPFILAFDSQILAQQFTLIEKDALNEIDWKDLIEMRWKDTPTESRSWVNFLRNCEPRGVEVVIARFNLMVKWAVSECVLTENLDERVRCIIKYIHIAAHCRKYRNFATMTQLTVALTSKDISRLTKTWAYVPAADVKTLKELEALVTPTGNFNNLRAEMEGAGADQGCIPFVGIYTHDLLVNQERPSQIASTPTTEPLINFERCRTDATIVKNLLRLLEASQLYRFLPIEGVTERCLWMAALSDEEITKYGKIIQD